MPRRAEPPDDGDGWKDLAGKRVALVKWDGIGDLVLATTFLHALHARISDGDITLFCQSHVAPLARSQFPGWRIQEVPARIKPLKRIYGQPGLRKQLVNMNPFDILIDLRSMRDTADAVMASWIPARHKVALQNQYRTAGVAFAREESVYDQLLPGPRTATEDACLDILNYRRFRDLFLQESGAAAADPVFPTLKISRPAQEELRRRLAQECAWIENEPFLLVSPGSLEPIKEYPPRELAVAIREVLERIDIPIVVTGSAQDRRTTASLREALEGKARLLDLTGQLSLDEHAVLVSMARAVLCMDSATAHFAGALRRPAVIILGGGHPGIFAPWGEADDFRWLQNPLACYGCNWVCIFDKPLCIRDISPEFIAQNLLEVLAVRVRG